MEIRYIIEDELHAEQVSEHYLFDAAGTELQRLASSPWDTAPNKAPCQSWETCGRQYVVIECDVSARPWRELSRMPALKVSANGSTWDAEFAQR
jgi:hypothetical protein